MAEEKKKRPQDRWDERAGVKTKGYKLHIALADEFKETCKRIGISQARALEGLMKEFIEENRTQ